MLSAMGQNAYLGHYRPGKQLRGVAETLPAATLLSQSELGPTVFGKQVPVHLTCNGLSKSLIRGTQTLYVKIAWLLAK